MLSTSHLVDVIDRLTRRWDDRDIDGVLDLYTDDIHYTEPGAGVSMVGRDPLRKYLGAYFKAWDTRWHIREHHRLEGQDALIAVWDMEVWRPGTQQRVVTKGMDILRVRDGQVASDIVYFDRLQLKPLHYAG